MKFQVTIILFFVSSTGFGQLTIPDAKTAAKEHNFRSYRYHEEFEGHAGYAAPIILTDKGEAIFFGDSKDGKFVNLVKLDKDANLL